ncbi:MAG: transporter [Verrucomicrobiales bacterium]|nr:transporter [Verrucomicrobiales bacterium]
MKPNTFITAVFTGTMLALAPLAHGQPSAHYPPGVEGLKGASLPPPGVYFRDYNWFYFSSRLNDDDGDEINGADAEAFVYANVPRVLWITDWKILGGFLGLDALLPLKYTDLEVNTPGGPFSDSTFGIGDLFAEATLSWHPKQFDLAIGYGVWAPTGDFNAQNPTWAGAGFWTHMFTAGATWYPDAAKKWALSALSRYEINHEQQDTDITPGHAYTLEWGLSYSPRPTVDLGVVGYWQIQTTEDDGPGASSDRDQVVAIGPEINAVCPKLGLITSLRYLYEVAAESRLQGHTVCLTLTKKL